VRLLSATSSGGGTQMYDICSVTVFSVVAARRFHREASPAAQTASTDSNECSIIRNAARRAFRSRRSNAAIDTLVVLTLIGIASGKIGGQP
jgi:hypothetical protein